MGRWVCFVSCNMRVWAAAKSLETRNKAWSCHQRANFSTFPPCSECLASPDNVLSNNYLKNMSQIIILNGTPTYLDIFYFHYITTINLKKTSEVKLVQPSHNYPNPREITSKLHIQKNTS